MKEPTRIIVLKPEISEIGVVGEEAESFIVFGASEGPVSHLGSVAGADSFPRPTNKATTPPPQQQPHQDRTSHVCWERVELVRRRDSLRLTCPSCV